MVIRATTQEHLDIEDITQNMIVMKDGSCAVAIRVGALNFNLLSEEEQDAIFFAYSNLLNSLSFPIQILIRSHQKDITAYAKLLEKEEQKQTNEIIKNRLAEYRVFVSSLVKERRVLEKNCYAIIPFHRAELGLAATNPLKPVQSLPYNKDYIIGRAKVVLEPRRDHLIREFGRIGLVAREVPTQDLIEMFYSSYNPSVPVAAVKDMSVSPIN